MLVFMSLKYIHLHLIQLVAKKKVSVRDLTEFDGNEHKETMEPDQNNRSSRLQRQKRFSVNSQTWKEVIVENGSQNNEIAVNSENSIGISIQNNIEHDLNSMHISKTSKNTQEELPKDNFHSEPMLLELSQRIISRRNSSDASKSETESILDIL